MIFKIKFKKTTWLYFLSALLFLLPKIFSLLPALNTLYILVCTFGILIAVSLLFYEYVYIKSKLSICFCIFLLHILWLEFVNIIHESIGRSFLMQIIPAMGMLLIIGHAFRKGQHEQFLEAYSLYFTLIIILNMSSQIVCGSNGIYHDWTTSWQAYYVCENAFFVEQRPFYVGGYAIFYNVKGGGTQYLKIEEGYTNLIYCIGHNAWVLLA